MRRLLVIALILLASGIVCAQQDAKEAKEYAETLKARIQTQVLDAMGNLMMGNLNWPAKKVTLDVRDASIRHLAELLSTQTGITFIVKEGVPGDLKITLHVSNMGVKQFLDTLSSTTNLTYIAESRADEPDDLKLEVPKRVHIGKPVTHVTISSLKAEGVIVNAGLVDASINEGDPIEVALKILKQMDASYVVMSLKDYLALQDAPRAEQIRKAVQENPKRGKVTLSLRKTPVLKALRTIANGQFYITVTGNNSYLIIPDVKVLDDNVMHPLSQLHGDNVFMGDLAGLLNEVRSSGGRFEAPITSQEAEARCRDYVKKLIVAIRMYADDHAGYLPDGKTWVSEIPVVDPAMLGAGPDYQKAYAINAALSGRKLADIKNPEKTVLIFECDSPIGQGTEADVAKSFRHPNGNTYGFLGGEVKVLKEVPKFNP